MTYMLHSKRCHMDYQPPSNIRTLLPVANGASSSDGWASYPTSKVSKTLSLSSISLASACTPDFWKPSGPLSRSGPWNSNFFPLVKYLQPWGPATPGTTSWGNSTFARADNS